MAYAPANSPCFHVLQILDIDEQTDEAVEGAAVDLDATRTGKAAVIKTTTRQTVFLPIIGLVDAAKLKPGDLVGVQKESYLVLDTLPAEYDTRVKAMEVDERPTETYQDIGGLDKQIEELVEAIVLPMKHPEKFKTLGIKPPKGCLMYGPPGMLKVRSRCDSRVAHADLSASCPPYTHHHRHRKDVTCTSMCCSDRRLLPQASCPFACANVHR